MEDHIVTYPDTRLATPSEPVKEFDDGLAALLERMKELLYIKRGLGLAAVQAGEPLRVVLVRNPDKKELPKAFINPRIVHTAGSVVDDEGCLSLPGLWLQIPRPVTVRLEAQNERGEPVQAEYSDYMARAVMHEMDHLDGRLLWDHLPGEERDEAKKRFAALQQRR